MRFIGEHLFALISSNVYATDISGSVTSVHIQEPTIWEMFGFSRYVGAYLANAFGYKSVVTSLHAFNLGLTVLFFILIVSLMYFLMKVMRYVDTKDEKPSFINSLKLVPLIMDKDSFEFFDKYCKRNPDGTFECSYTQHVQLQKWGKFSLHGAFFTIGLKITVILLLFLINSGYLEAFSGRTSANYTIFIDSQMQTGGVLTSSLAGYGMTASVGEPIGSATTESANYTESSGMQGIEDEVSIGLTYANATNLDFGTLDTQSTAYGTHTLTIYYNGNLGADIMLFGSPPTAPGGHVITGIGGANASPTPGTEQFGINLVGNTVPAVVGADVSPLNSALQATTAYNQANKFAWEYGDVIATASDRVHETTFTVTVIMNISELTPAGAYATDLVYTIVPRY